MPTIPVETSQKTLQPQLREPLRREATAEAKPLQQITSALQKTAQAWQQAHDTMQLTKAKADYSIGLAEIDARAAQDPDFNNAEQYEKERNTLKSTALQGIDNQSVAQQTAFEFEVDGKISGLKTQTLYRTREIEQNKVNFVSALDSMQKKINSAETRAAQQIYMDNRDELIASNLQAGTITPDEAAQYLSASIENSVLTEISNDTATTESDSVVLENIRKRQDVDEKAKLELISKSQTKIKQNEQKMKKEAENFEIYTYEQQFQAQQQFEEDVNNLPLEEALSKIDDGAIRGIYDEGWAKARTKALLSTVGIDTAKQNEWEAQMMLSIDSIGTTLSFAQKSDKKGFKDVKTYLKGVREAEIKILEGKAQGLTNEATAKSLLEKLYSSKTAEATEYMSTKGYAGYDTKKAFKNVFSKQLSVGDSYRAVRMFYNESLELGKKLDNKAGAALAVEISDRIKNENRVEVLDSNDAKLEGGYQTFATAEEAEAADIPVGTLVNINGQLMRKT